MKLIDFLKEKILYIVSSISILAITIAILWVLSPDGGPALSLLIGALYLIGTVSPLAIEYVRKKEFYDNLLRIFDRLDRKNLIAEVITAPGFKEGILLYEIVKGSNKAMLEEISKYKYLQEEYREYIELWIHEVKTPISSSRLLAQNNKNAVMESISEELDKIEAYVEQVLFYSRSNAVEKDYIVKELHLQKCCFDVLKKNARIFIQNKIRVVTENLDLVIYSDEKWLQFIINQVLLNSVKYSDKPDAFVQISAVESKNNVVLSIADNGVGIHNSELSRIFDKGFTGTNGRKNQRSTGMGLYICKKLCDKLGLSIRAESEIRKGTLISIIFPKNSMVDIR